MHTSFDKTWNELAIPRYGSWKYLLKPAEFLIPFHILFQFHEILKSKGAC